MIKWYKNNGENKRMTSLRFKIDRKRIRDWVNQEENIRNQWKESWTSGSGRRSFSHTAEKQLHVEFIQLRKEGKKIKHWWFTARMKQLMEELYPNKAEMFRYSDWWFRAFCRRYNVSLRSTTHVAQKSLEEAINEKIS